MKRRFMLAVATLLVLGLGSALVLTGCGTSTTSSGSTTSAGKSEESSATSTTNKGNKLAFGETGTWKGIEITVSEPTVDTKAEFVSEGKKVVYCTVVIKNNSDKDFDYNALGFTMFDSEHQSYDAFGMASVPDLSSGTLAPGETVKGAIAYEMPENATPGGIKWQPTIADSTKLVWGNP